MSHQPRIDRIEDDGTRTAMVLVPAEQQAEIERLRAALRRCASEATPFTSKDHPAHDFACRVAAEALEALEKSLSEDIHPAAAEQPAPAGEGIDVCAWLMARVVAGDVPEELVPAFTAVEEVCADLGWSTIAAMAARREKGVATYGGPLRTGNGRSWKVDYAKEAIDALYFIAQGYLEECATEADVFPRCRVCGCTDERACPGGCSWVEDPGGGDLCSACADAGGER